MKKDLLVDLNCDMGELTEMTSDVSEALLMRYITSANIACGAHAGDRRSMEHTVHLAIEHSVRIGAHPSYPDRKNFGRVELAMPEDALEDSITSQIATLGEIAAAAGSKLTHVKPHGALYHAADREASLARLVGRATAKVSPDLMLVGRADSPMLSVWQEMGFKVAGEAFADRAYQASGKLRSRTLPGSLYSDPQKASEQAWQIAHEHKVVALDQTEIPVHADTICIHSDTAGAVSIARAVYERLEKTAAVAR